MFYKKEKRFKSDPLEDKGIKRAVYYYFFEKGSELGFDMYLVMGLRKYLGGLKFNAPLYFNPGKAKFEILDKEIVADAVLDRSGGVDFPPLDISEKVLDHRKFKLICWNKILMYEYLGGFSPLSFPVMSFLDLQKNSGIFKHNEMAVLKPSVGLKGRDVHIDLFSNILRLDIDFNKKWVLQKYVDTSGGIKGLVKGEHDLRVVIVNGKIIYSHIRQPALGKKTANVGQGGSITEINIEQIPQKILEITRDLKEKIDSDFDKPLYSIDYGVQNEEPVVFELNDTIGFPSDKMKKSRIFIDEVLEALRLRTKR